MRTDAKLDRGVAAIGDLSRQDLVEAWIKAHATSPPKGIKRPLLELSAAWQLQARRVGGLSVASRKALLKAGSSRRENGSSGPPHGGEKSETRVKQLVGASERNVPAPGTRLMREWNGRMYVVDVTGTGYQLDGKPYRSLSAIARRITGARWSGPRFFGL